MQYLDITLPVREGLPSWPGDPEIHVTPVSRIADGNAESNVTYLASTTHFGTHVDAPWHFLPGGSRVDEMDLNLLIGRCYVLDLRQVTGGIRAAHLAMTPEGVERLLVRTRNSDILGDEAFHPDYIGLLPDAAEELARRGIRLFGLDYYSIGDIHHNPAVHTAFLSQRGAVALEGVVLRDVEEGWYDLICLPLRLQALDGAPCRAVLAPCAP